MCGGHTLQQARGDKYQNQSVGAGGSSAAQMSSTGDAAKKTGAVHMCDSSISKGGVRQLGSKELLKFRSLQSVLSILGAYSHHA